MKVFFTFEKNSFLQEIAIGDFSYEGKTVVVEYKGGRTGEIALTEDMIPEVERLKFYKIGEHEVKVVYNNRYLTTFKINVRRRTFEDIYRLEGYTCTYDGNPHRVWLNYDLPEGAKIDFEYGNAFTNAGTYEVVGVISKEGYESKTVQATLVIEKARYDLSDMRMEDLTTVYDGEVKTIAAQGVPDEVTVSYDVYDGDVKINGAVQVGTYKVVAHFAIGDNNYERIPDSSATLTIQKADYDMSRVTLADHTKTYDGTEYLPSLTTDSVLPQGVTVSYAVYQDGNRVVSNAKAGEYEVVASFRGNTVNYNPIPDLRATLTVNKRVIAIGSSVTLDDVTVNYDGQMHSLVLNGQLPNGVSATYENNDQIYAGEYEVVAHFAATDANETVDVPELRAVLIINQIRGSVKIDDRDVNGDDLFYDKTTYTMTLLGLDTETYGVHALNFYIDNGEDMTKIEWGDPAQALELGKTYRYVIVYNFVNEDLDRSIRLSATSGNYTHYEPTFEAETVVYDGNPHTIEARHVPTAIEVTYETYLGDDKVDEAVDVGVYRIVAHFAYDGDQDILPSIEAVLTIQKADYDMSSVVFEDVTVTYDEEVHTIQAQLLPAGVQASYDLYKGEEAVDVAQSAGVYRVVAHFTGDVNHNPISDREATLTINKRTIVIDGVTLVDAVVDYDGQAHSLEIEGELPQGVQVSYQNNGNVTWGVYEVVALFASIDMQNEQVDVSELRATLTIVYTFTGEGVTFEDETLDFDYQDHSIFVSELPQGVGVEYEGNNQRYAGTYEITAHFVSLDENVVIINAADKTATLTINKISEDIFIDGDKISSQDFLYDVDNVILNIKGFDPELYDYMLIKFSWPLYPNGHYLLWFYYNDSAGQTNKLTGDRYSGQEIYYEITFQYHDADLRSSVELNKMTGYCVYDASDNTFTECVSTDDSES